MMGKHEFLYMFDEALDRCLNGTHKVRATKGDAPDPEDIPLPVFPRVIPPPPPSGPPPVFDRTKQQRPFNPFDAADALGKRDRTRAMLSGDRDVSRPLRLYPDIGQYDNRPVDIVRPPIARPNVRDAALRGQVNEALQKNFSRTKYVRNVKAVIPQKLADYRNQKPRVSIATPPPVSSRASIEIPVQPIDRSEIGKETRKILRQKQALRQSKASDRVAKQNAQKVLRRTKKTDKGVMGIGRSEMIRKFIEQGRRRRGDVINYDPDATYIEPEFPPLPPDSDDDDDDTFADTEADDPADDYRIAEDEDEDEDDPSDSSSLEVQMTKKYKYD